MSNSTEIRPFHISVPDDALADLRQRIQATRWPERETVNDDSQGVPLATMQDLAREWASNYDWREVEARLNSYPQFMTEIDGLDIHFIHVRSQHENALPLIMTHGWPGSVIELLDVIDPLTNPTAHGGSEEDAFHLVLPSMPGYGFSEKPKEAGWSPSRIASAWVELMKRLGYTQFVAQGGDWGAVINDVMAMQAPPELLGIHTNFASTVPHDIGDAAQAGKPAPDGLSADEKRAYEQASLFAKRFTGYAIEMGNRPQTLYGLADSPVGLAGWILDGHPPNELILLQNERTRKQMLDNITLYWLTNTGVSAARLYWETLFVLGGRFLDAVDVSIPAAVSVFPREIYQAPESWTRQAYHNLVHYNQVEKGGHFAAWEEPEIFTNELRSGLRSLRGAATPHLRGSSVIASKPGKRKN